MEKMVVIFNILNNDTTQTQDLLIYMLISHRSEAAFRLSSWAIIQYNQYNYNTLPGQKNSHHLDLTKQIDKIITAVINVFQVITRFSNKHVRGHILWSCKRCFRGVNILACIKQRKQLRRLLKLPKTVQHIIKSWKDSGESSWIFEEEMWSTKKSWTFLNQMLKSQQ